MSSEVFFLPAKADEGHEVLAAKTKKIYEALGLHENIEKDSFVI